MKKKLLFLLLLILGSKSFSQEDVRDDILLFPNTASTQINLVLPEIMSPTDISIYDVSGRLIKKIPLNDSSLYNIDTKELTQGMYLAVISTEFETLVKKFIVDPNSLNSFSYYDGISEPLKQVSLAANISTGTKILEPLDDAYLEGATRYNTTISKVYTSWRSSYFRFDLNSIPGTITSAKLQFTVDSDAGSGTIEVYKGNSTNWTEENLSTSNRPSKSSSPIGTTNGTHSIGKRVSIDLDVNSLSSSLQSLVMVQPTGMNDFAFITKEHTTKEAPKLVLTYEYTDGGSEDTNDDSNNDSTDNNSSNNTESNALSLAPLDDAYLEGGTRHNTSIVKVYTTWRSGYLKFDLRSIPGKITGASLKFTIDSDPGNGLIQVYKGNSTNWTEENLSTSNRPGKSSSPIGITTGTHSLGKRVSIDLDVNSLSNSLLSLVMTQAADTDDIAFVSKEHATKAAPELVITYEGSGDTTDTTEDTTDTTTDDTTTEDTTDNSDASNSILTPLDDAYIEGSTSHNTTISKVYTTWRSSYFKFDLRSLPSDMTSATLQFTIDSDAGNGLLQVYKGNSTNWTEENLSTTNRPGKGSSPIGSVNSTYGLGQRISIPLDINNLSNELLSLVMVQAPNTDDIAFATKEHPTIKGPQLVITYGDDPDGDTGKPPTEDSPVNFEITFENMQVLLAMQDALAAYTNKKQEEWLKKQENKFKDEINNQLGTNHTSFSTAQKDFFKNFEKNFLRVEERAFGIGSSHRRKAKDLDKEQEIFTSEILAIDEWKELRDNCSPRGLVYCGDAPNKMVRGTRIGGASINTLNNLKDAAIVDFSVNEYASAENYTWAQGMFKIVNDESLINTVTNFHLSNYNSQEGFKGLKTKVFLMTSYLVQYNNRNLGVLQQPIVQYTLPVAWSPQTLLAMGKQKAPEIPEKAGAFDANYVNAVLSDCYAYNSVPGGQGQQNSRDCNKVKDDLIKLKNEVIEDHLIELLDYEEFGMTIKMNKIRSRIQKFNGKGKIGGLDALEYTNYIPDGTSGNRFYALKNGGWVYESNSPMAPNGGVPISEPSLNDNGLYYYIHNEDTGNWHELFLPATGVSISSDTYLVDAIWKGIATVARYATPIEDVIILIDGKDFDGNEASRAEAGVWLVVGIVPGGKVFKPVVKGTGKLIMIARAGNKTIQMGLKRGGEALEILKNARKIAGKALGNGVKVNGKWLKGTEGNAGFFPKGIADKMRNQNFANFDAFREQFWKNVGADPTISKEFSSSNITRMKNGLAPKVIDSQKLGGQGSYILHHQKPINQGGKVYDMDNLLIVTPRYHKEILSPGYHFGYGYN